VIFPHGDAHIIENGLPTKSVVCLAIIKSMSMANCYFAEPHGMKHCYIPFFMLLISNALLALARHRTEKVAHNGPSDPEYFRLAHPSKILEQLSKMQTSSPLVCALAIARHSISNNEPLAF
jgi:hypothetical protein